MPLQNTCLPPESQHSSSDLASRALAHVQSVGPLRYGPLTLGTRYLLSPLAGFTNLSFRRVLREIGGVGLCTTDLVNARGLLAESPRTCELVETHPTEQPFSVQIFGGDPAIMVAAARLLVERGVHLIDINMGCPVNKVTKTGAGASLMCATDSTVDLVRQIVEAVPVPVTVKMRLGWDDSNLTAPTFAREFEQVGVASVMIHGRTRAQGFSGRVNLDGIRQVVAAVQRIPVIGNGDIRTLEEAWRMFAETGCQGISIGRGALANPWIFRQLAAWETGAPPARSGSFTERLELMQRQFSYLEERRGTERALSQFRKTAHWYLKAMTVPAALRHDFQEVRSATELRAVLQRIAELGPTRQTENGELPQMQIPVPTGPIEHW